MTSNAWGKYICVSYEDCINMKMELEMEVVYLECRIFAFAAKQERRKCRPGKLKSRAQSHEQQREYRNVCRSTSRRNDDLTFSLACGPFSSVKGSRLQGARYHYRCCCTYVKHNTDIKATSNPSLWLQDEQPITARCPHSSLRGCKKIWSVIQRIRDQGRPQSRASTMCIQ